MADAQEQKQPLAVSEVHLNHPPDAATTTPQDSVPTLSTAQDSVKTTRPDASQVSDHLETVAHPPAQQPFSVLETSSSEVWSADQYIPTDSDLAAALGQTPDAGQAQIDSPSAKPELNVPSPSSVLPQAEVTQLLSVLEQGTVEGEAAPQTTAAVTEVDGINYIATTTPGSTTNVPTDHAVTPDDSTPSYLATPTVEASGAAGTVDPASELQQPNGVDTSPSSPTAMASYHHPPGEPRPPITYAASPSYGAPSLHPPHYGFQTNAAQSNHGYPPAANTARGGAIALPSMRTFDSGLQHTSSSQQQIPRQPPLSMSIPGGTQPGGSLGYSQQPPPLGSNGPYGLHHDRYSLQGDAHGMFGANRHKKEIKRRTKTGCLTCRKRRIKCDETHPTCKNCQKSKRECLGYDPIFKQQQQHTPTNIQPAPNHSAGSSSSTPSHSLATPTTSASASSPPYHHYSLSNSTLSHSPSVQSGYGTATPYHGTTAPAFANILTFPTRKMRVDELINIEGHGTPALEGPMTAEQLNECRDLYEQVYAPGLESFFEAKWYILAPGYDALATDSAVNEVMIGFLNTVRNLDPHDTAGMQYSASLEFRVVWDLARLVSRVDTKAHPGPDLPPIDDAHEIKNRVAVLEALLSGDFLDHNPLSMPPSDGDYHRIREYRFWYFLGEFLRFKKPETPNMAAQKTQTLSMLRELLDGRENRDVIYSLVVIRDLAPRFPPDFENNLPPHLDESDPKSKLAVARKFIQDESQVAGGTTNVVRRIAELGVRAFILPGGNIPR
ncbi:hypothetical protein Micbo1qcDRAFT_194715 [Microdochium bolleyi]|uniref:Zn(2)-C6 fungal-type domain-containing protein n=1 Tax=Microdochium bolleyi TaxID=196109 RepID=A0A136J3A7_9PEZI|nr:hypothetical protein Micbo1qcDRAFT_194715 [Microdochium bolleyi]